MRRGTKIEMRRLKRRCISIVGNEGIYSFSPHTFPPPDSNLEPIA
jgi:hypothetical protein